MNFKSYLELELDVEVTHYEPYRSGWSSNPELWVPDDDEYIEIEVLYRGVDITDLLSKDDYDRLCDEAIERIKED
jgi:hypothetical protein